MLPMVETERVNKASLDLLLIGNRLGEVRPLPPMFTQQIRDMGPDGDYVGPTSRLL